MKHIFRLMALTVLIAAFSCNQKSNLMEFSDEGQYESPQITQEADVSADLMKNDRKIIREGEITFQSTDAQLTREVISKSVREFQGYIAKDNIYKYSDRDEHRISIRIPASKFDSLLEKITNNAEKIDQKNIYTRDVTEEFVDVEARLNTKKELENRYIDLLKQANKVEDILAIEREIGLLRSDIESIEGRLRYLRDRVELSTLDVVFYEKTPSSMAFGSKIGHALGNGWSYLLLFLVFLTNLWPFVIIVLIVLFIHRWYKGKKGKTAKY